MQTTALLNINQCIYCHLLQVLSLIKYTELFVVFAHILSGKVVHTYLKVRFFQYSNGECKEAYC